MKDTDVWQCSCGENFFLLMRDGTIICEACEKPVPAEVVWTHPNAQLQPTAGQRSTELWAPPAASSATNRRIPRMEGGSAASSC